MDELRESIIFKQNSPGGKKEREKEEEKKEVNKRYIFSFKIEYLLKIINSFTVFEIFNSEKFARNLLAEEEEEEKKVGVR